MNNLSEYILEKLHLNKDTDSYMGEKFWTEDVDDADSMLELFYNNRKLKNKKIDGVLKNRPWYAVYVYLRTVGKAKPKEILDDVFPGTVAQRTELFAGLREHNIIETIKTGPDKGYYIPKEVKDFRYPQNFIRYPLW